MVKNRSGARALLVGCGDLGSRHLQALASGPWFREIEVVDPRPEAWSRAQARLAETPGGQVPEIRWLRSLDEASKGGDLCILATQADIRDSLFYDIATSKDYLSFLLEKMVTTSIREYEKMMSVTQDLGLSVWVNCKSRAHYSHKHVKKFLDSTGPICLQVFGGNQGLATNGVHVADLFCFYDETDQIHLDESRVDPVLHPSKRGEGLYDLSGSLCGSSDKGSRLAMTMAAHHAGPMLFIVKSKEYRAAIDDETKCIYESTAAGGWEWKRVPYDHNIFVSHLSGQFASDILSTGRCELPTLESCYPAHKFILGELLHHFNQLLGVESDRCPVT